MESVSNDISANASTIIIYHRVTVVVVVAVAYAIAVAISWAPFIQNNFCPSGAVFVDINSAGPFLIMRLAMRTNAHNYNF